MDPALLAGAYAQLQNQMQQQQAAQAQQQAAHAQQMQQMQAAQQQLQQQLAAQQQQQQQVQPAPQLPRGPHMRIAAPPSYDGRIGALDLWLSSMLQQFDYYAYHDDADRIRNAVVLLTGAARDWWQQLAAKPAAWDELVVDMRERFQPIDSAQTTRTKLLALQQGKASAAEYVNAFRRLVGGVASTMAPEDQLHQFKRGLNPSIAAIINLHGITTLEDAEKLAVRASATAVAPSSSPASSSSAPMDVHNIEGLDAETGSADNADAPVTQRQLHQLLAAMQNQRRGESDRREKSAPLKGEPRPLPVIKGMTPAQVKEYMDAGKCFGCGSDAHMSHWCPKRVVKDGKVSWSN
jgi:hypothetical protein